MKKLIAVSLYPLTICASVAGAYFLLYTHQLPLLSILLPLGLVFVLVGIMERLQPYRASWNIAQDDLATDTAYLSVNVLLRELINALFKIGILGLAAAAGLSGGGVEIWPTSWHPFAQLVLALLVFDFFEYWYHRATHRYGFLWRFHAIHHSPKRLYFFNAARFHFVDWIVLTAIEVAVLFAIGADEKLIAMCIIFIQVHGLFQHANIDLKRGPLNYLVSGPELHRWHHSKLIRESDTNFGNNVIVWDIVFGTYFLPKRREVGVIGLLNDAYPHTFLGQMKAAFSKKPLDKPADYYGNESLYEEKVIRENQAINS